jgi:PKD repeat protein
MKQLSSILLIAAIAISCNKSSNSELTTGSSSNYPPPSAAFSINNMVSSSGSNLVQEAKLLEINNSSNNGSTYVWNFGNGTTSTDKNPVFFYPLHGNYKLTLTVTSVDGKTATSSVDLTVWCSRGLNHAPVSQPD